MRKYLFIRKNQLHNFIKKNGLIFVLLSVCVCVLLFIIIEHRIRKFSIPHTAYYLLSFNILLIGYIRANRNDLKFLTITVKDIYSIQILDYSVISMPFIVLYILNNWHINIILLLFSIVGIPTFKRFRTSYSNNFKKLFPFWIKWNNYEWIAGLRKFNSTITLIMLLAISFAWHEYFTVIILSFYIGLLPAFYKNFEPSIFLECYDVKPTKIVIAKSLRHSILNLMILCSGIPYVIFNNKYYYLIALLMLLSTVVIIWLNISKYNFYKPNASTFKSDITSNLVTACIFPFIFLLPIAILFMLFLYKKSLQNLKYYLDD